MTSRLISLEKSHRTLRKELVKKDREVLEWKRKYESIAEAAEDDGIAKAAEQLQEVQRANFLLRGQVHEMESFLQDYGLIWVGANVATDEPSLSENIGSRIDFSMLFRRLHELNALAGEGKTHISKDGKNARFNFDPEKIPLAVFQDGVSGCQRSTVQSWRPDQIAAGTGGEPPCAGGGEPAPDNTIDPTTRCVQGCTCRQARCVRRSATLGASAPRH